MYNGTNPSALRSREWLCSAMLDLLKLRKFDEITIKDVCREADLSRQTFYQIFESKEEIIEYHFGELFSEFRVRCAGFDCITLTELTIQFFTFFSQQADFIQVLTENNMSYVLERQFERYLPEIGLFQRINETEAFPDYTVSYVAGALCQILIHWYEKGMDLSVNQIASMTEQLITGKHLRGDGHVLSQLDRR